MNRNHFPQLPISQTADFSGLLMFYACRSAYIVLQKPSAANGNTCRDGGYYVHSRDQLSFNILATMRVIHITFQVPLSCVILEFLCEQQPDNFLAFHTPYPVSRFCQLHHCGVKGYEKGSGQDKNGFDFRVSIF